MIRNRDRTVLAWLTTGLLLFTQALGVVQACSDFDAKPAMAFAEGDCHEPVNPNQCLQHCTAFDQSAQHTEVAVPLPFSTAVLTLPYFEHSGVAVCSIKSPVVVATTGPPPSIQFCSLQL
jgi:hypothetical protein